MKYDRPQKTAAKNTRRAFLLGTTLVLTNGVRGIACPDEHQTTTRFGMITDLHYADKSPSGSRHYRDTLAKLEKASDQIQKATPDFMVELGDLIDAADSVETELRYLKRINQEFSQLAKQRHYVLGNHCVDTLKKEEFLSEVQQKQSFYSFDSGNTHFIIIDSCFRSDGTPYSRKNFKWTDANVPSHELEWLRSDLANTTLPTIVLAHQRLDTKDNHGVRNAADVREVFENSGKVQAVFQGHSHKNDYKDLNGIHYCTMVAMVEGKGVKNNGFSLVQVKPDTSIVVEGFVKQNNYQWTGKAK
ncbi:MAG TPA: alkaline phosphatase [Rhodopirellula sp.]|nr:alkaline phosphatase [Rhodopirellula sp.]